MKFSFNRINALSQVQPAQLIQSDYPTKEDEFSTDFSRWGTLEIPPTGISALRQLDQIMVEL